MTRKALTVSPIGYVHTEHGGFALEIRERFRPALRGLEGFSHVNVLWWCHLTDGPELRRVVECEQPYRRSPAKLGIFATRSPLRPNPIALSAVAVLSVDHERGVIHVPHVDAEDGSPILDLKPYHPAVDRIRAVTVPTWCRHWPAWYEDSASFDWAAEFVTAR